jgi:hypothetical protein
MDELCNFYVCVNTETLETKVSTDPNWVIQWIFMNHREGMVSHWSISEYGAVSPINWEDGDE